MPDERVFRRDPLDDAATEIVAEPEQGWVQPHEEHLPDAVPRAERRPPPSERLEPPLRRQAPSLAPALLVILGLTLAGVAAAWYWTSRDEREPVPSVAGLTVDRAIARLREEGFATAAVNRANEADAGTVFSQDPRAGAEADEGSTVRVLVSGGPATRPAPNAVGLDETVARDRLAAAGLEVVVDEVFSDEPEGSVVAQDPPAGRRVGEGQRVRLEVSKGTGLAELPSLVGRSGASAEAELGALGLRASVHRVPSREPADTVVAQHPAPGEVRVGSTVRLNVSTGS